MDFNHTMILRYYLQIIKGFTAAFVSSQKNWTTDRKPVFEANLY